MNNLARIAVGLAALGRPAYVNLGRGGALPATRDVAAMRDVTFAVLDAAYARGVRRVDVARSYGRAEEFLAQWLATRGRHDLVVSSKWGYDYVGGWRIDAAVHEEKEHSLARFERQWEQTAALLGGELALYQVHSLTADSPLFSDRALLDALAALADRGVRVGFSTSGPAQRDTIRRAMALEAEGVRVFSAVQSTWNPLEPSAGEALAEAHTEGALVQLKETVANGRLVVEAPGAVRRPAAAHGVGPDAVAIAAALARPWADVVLAGPASVAQLDGNLAAVDLRLTGDELDTLDALRESPEAYWGRRSDLPWH